MQRIDLSQLTKILSCFDNYKKLYYNLYWDKTYTTLKSKIGLLESLSDAKGKPTQIGQAYWDRVDIHVVLQSYGSTSGGWGGIGGAAMTDEYSIVFYNPLLNAYFVYYNTTLAYVVENNEKLKEIINGDLNRLPPYYNIDSYNVFYKKEK